MLDGAPVLKSTSTPRTNGRRREEGIMRRREFIDRLKKGGAAAAIVSLGGAASCGGPAKETPAAEAPVFGARDPGVEVDL